jgi:hypothetical protein
VGGKTDAKIAGISMGKRSGAIDIPGNQHIEVYLKDRGYLYY